eukprot:927677-Rhodomonas_salina.8
MSAVVQGRVIFLRGMRGTQAEKQREQHETQKLKAAQDLREPSATPALYRHALTRDTHIHKHVIPFRKLQPQQQQQPTREGPRQRTSETPTQAPPQQART